MREKEKPALSSLATASAGGAVGTSKPDHISILSQNGQCVKFSQTEQRVYSLLPTGSRNAVHAADLAKMARLNGRELRGVLEGLRNKGVFICADGRGVYLAESLNELKSWVKARKAAALSILRTTKDAQAAISAAEKDAAQRSHPAAGDNSGDSFHQYTLSEIM